MYGGFGAFSPNSDVFAKFILSRLRGLCGGGGRKIVDHRKWMPPKKQHVPTTAGLITHANSKRP